MRRSLLALLPLMTLVASCEGDIVVFSIEGDLQVNPTPLDFGAMALGDEATGQLFLANTGQARLEVLSITMPTQSGFTLLNTFNGEIAPEGVEVIEVAFAPSTEGYVSAPLTIVVGAADAEDAVTTVTVRGRAVEAGLVAIPGRVDLGPVEVGEDETGDLTLDNLSDIDIVIEDVEFDGDGGFSLNPPAFLGPLPWILPPGPNPGFEVQYDAVDENPADASLRLLSPARGVAELEIPVLANDCESSGHPGWDADADGYRACAGDCDDADPTAFPGATELEDGIDNDCDGIADEGTDAYDDDGDGLSEAEGDCNDAEPDVYLGAEEIADGVDNDCDMDVDEGTEVDDIDGDGYTTVGGDCDPGTGSVYPGAPELADGLDNDCDGEVDEDTILSDDDGDGFAEDTGDCDDGDPTVHPGAPELDDGIDNDCDGEVDAGTGGSDDDGDGYTEAGGDCDDVSPVVNPAAVELVNGLDDDCDGLIDEGTTAADDDGDGYSELAGDCNDGDPLAYPGADEGGPSGDGVDNDCDGDVDEGTDAYDDDRDGFTEDGGDCDDTRASVSPARLELPGDGLDNDCDGVVD